MRSTSAFLLCSSLLVSLPGCVPVVLGGAAAGAGYAAGQERGGIGTVRDTAIKAQVADKWLRYNEQMANELSATVYDGKVLITGAVSNPEWRVQAVRLAWQVDGVKEVHSETTVADKSTLVDDARDTWITTRLRSAITLDPKIRSLNYSIDTVNGVVYLMGSARTQGELDLVTNYARNTPNVKRVVSYVEIRSGEPHAPEPATTAGAPATAPATAAPAAPPPATAAPQPVAPPSGPPAAIESRPLS